MNQALKYNVYTKGSVKQAEFLAELGGMNREERELFMMLHEGKSDLFIQEELGLTRRSYERVEESVRAKLLLAVFDCINKCYNDNN